MKKRILSIVICLCLMLAVLNSLEISFVATAATTPRTLKCTCDAVPTATAPSNDHYYYCELFCSCTYYTESASTHSEETCPCFSCADAGKSSQWRGCSSSTSGTTSVSKGGTTYTAKGTITHVNTCMKFKQTCAGLSGCNTATTPQTHVLGCPMYTTTVSSDGSRTPEVCSICGWLFGEHYRYCRSTANSGYYNKLAEVVGLATDDNCPNIYIPEEYTNGNGGISAKYTVAELKTNKATIGLSDNDISVIEKAAQKNALKTQYIYYKKFDTVNIGSAPNKTYDIHIPEKSIVILDLNGNRIWGSGYGPAIVNYGTLIILDSRPTNLMEGELEDRGYYFYDDQAGDYFHSVRNAEDAVFTQGVDDTNVSAEKKVWTLGGVILGGRTTRNNVYGVGKGSSSVGTSTATLNQGKTYEEILDRTEYHNHNVSENDAKRYFFTYLVENNELGNVYGFGGGGIHNEGTVIMNGGTIVGCESMENGEGAAVYSTGTGASFTMNGGSIRYNFGNSIVAAENGATLNINNGTIFRNVGVGNGAIRGESVSGATNKTTINIGEDGDTVDTALVDTLLPESNKANLLIGLGTCGILNKNYNTEVKTPIIAYNRSLAGISTDGNGGGIYAENINLNLKAAVIMENWAHYRGGGVDIFNEGNVTLSGNLLIKNNYCEYKGGGIAVRNPNSNSAKLSLTINSDNVVVTGNKAAYGAGIYHSYGDFNMSAGELSNNESVGYYISTTNYNALSYFVAIDEDKENDDIRDLNISKDTPYNVNDPSADMYNPTGYAKNWGYPELFDGAKTTDGYRTTQAIGFGGTVTDVSFAPRIASSTESYTYNGTSKWWITGVTSLRTSTHGGGGIYIEGDSDTNVIISGNAKITNNRALDNGGAIFLTNGTVEMNGGTISDNYISGYEVTRNSITYPQKTLEGQFKSSVDATTGKYNGNTAGVNGSKGGAIYISNGKFVMNDGVIDNNLILSLGGDGAGVYVVQNDSNTYTEQYAFEMTGGEISNSYNYNDQGGGVHASGKVKISGTAKIHDNYACDNGGGVYTTGTFDMNGGEIYNNTAHDYIGGGVYTSGNFNMSAGKIYQNVALTRNGGGIYVRNGNFTMTGGEIYKNTALNTNSKQPSATAVGTQFGSGGGVCIQNGTVSITGDSQIYENQAAYKGGAIYLFASPRYSDIGTKTLTIGTTDANVAQPKIHDNKVEFSQFSEGEYGKYMLGGGAICIEGGGANLVINNADINNNILNGEHAEGGAIAIFEGSVDPATDKDSEQATKGTSTVTIKNVNAHHNESQNDHAGFLYLRNGNVDIYDGEFYENTAKDNGGCLYVANGKLVIDANKDGKVNIYNNTAERYVGGAIRVDAGNVEMYGGNIYGNKVVNAYSSSTTDGAKRGHGGAIDILTGTFKMYNGSIYGNIAGSDTTSINGHGGAVAIQDKGDVYVYGGSIQNNTAKVNGGAIYVNAGNIYIGKENCDGTSDDTHNNLDPKDSKCGHPIVQGNTAVNGGGLYSASGTTTFYCGSMTANTASNKGGGMYVEGGTITIENATVTGNTAAEHYYGDALYMTGGKITYTNADTFGNRDNTSTGVVVAGGTLENTGAIKHLIAVYFKDNVTKELIAEFSVPMGGKIVLPDGNDLFGEFDNQTFIGWQYPKVDDFVRYDGDHPSGYGYKLAGQAIEATDNSEISGDNPYSMTLYGVWANDVNTISYYKTFKESLTFSGDDYTTQYNYKTPIKFTLPTPTLAPGYTFTGWTRQQGSDCQPMNMCNANWGISENGDFKAAGAEFDTTGKFGNIHFYANWESEITYAAAYDDGQGINAGTTGGTVSRASDTVEVSNTVTAVDTITATPAANYAFIGWYTNAECTGDPITTDATLDPKALDNDYKNSGFYGNLEYYAKFALEYKDLTIKTSGADADQSFVFTVKGQDGYAANVEMQVYVIGGNSSVTIKHIPAGEYDIYENNVANTHQGDKWTWRYTDTNKQTAKVDGVLTANTNETDNDTVTFVYDNTSGQIGNGVKIIQNWLNGLSHKFIKGN